MQKQQTTWPMELGTGYTAAGSVGCDNDLVLLSGRSGGVKLFPVGDTVPSINRTVLVDGMSIFPPRCGFVRTDSKP
jgi:hypothetical protein